MRIDLIFPGITSCGFGAFGKFMDIEANFIHHGLASISAYLKSKGHNVGLIDLRKLAGWQDFRQAVINSPAPFFGISSMSCDYGVSEKAAAIIKEVKPASIIAIGGVHPTIATEEVLKNPYFNYVVSGEGEHGLSELLESLESNKHIGRVISGEQTDITKLPWVDRDIFDYENGESKTPLLKHMKPPFVSIITSRGCPYRCRFCQPAERAIFGNQVKIRPVNDVINELLYLKRRYHFNSFLIHDDLFILDGKYVDNFCAEYRKNGFTQKFTCQARADIIVNLQERIKKLADIGLDCLMVGFESASQRVLDFMDKGTTVQQNKKAVDICREYNIKLFANIMFGLPQETKRDMDETVRFVRSARPEYFSPAVFTPYPGSYLYDYCKENNLIGRIQYKNYRRNPFSGWKVKGVNYWLVYYEIFKCNPLFFMRMALRRIIGAKGAKIISALLKWIKKNNFNI